MELLLPEARPIDPADLLGLYDVPGPYVRAGMLVSLDGSISHRGTSRPLQAPGDLQVYAALRAVADVVLVGAGTARSEGYGPVALSAAAQAWRAGQGRAALVPLAVVSRSLTGLDDARWLRPGSFVVTCAAAPAQARRRLGETAEVLVCGDDTVDLAATCAELAARGLRRVLCEGGPSLLADLATAGLLTEVCATVSPVLAGGTGGMLSTALPAPAPLTLAHLLREQSTLLGRWVLA